MCVSGICCIFAPDLDIYNIKSNTINIFINLFFNGKFKEHCSY